VKNFSKEIKDRAERAPYLFRLLVWIRDGTRRWRHRIRIPLWLLRRPFQVRTYWKRERDLRLNLGCGPNPRPGWLNCDLSPLNPSVVYLDASLPFPLPSDSFAYVYSEHMVEHLDRRGVGIFFREVFRVLRPGGYVRLATPDLEKYIRLYTGEAPEMGAYARWIGERYTKDPGATPAQVLNNLFQNFGHRHLFDFHTMERFLETAGFDRIKRVAIDESEHEAFQNLERHGTQIPEEFNRLETLVVEARKPDIPA
jgi:predicted SAM-dependent methyltransferase